MVIRHLKDDPLFQNLTPEELDCVDRVVTAREFEPGQVIIRENEEAFSLFMLESGRVDVVKRSSSGDFPLLSTISSSSVFGELALLGNGMRHATVIARDHVRVYELNYAALDRLVGEHPSLGVKIYRVICKGLIEKITKTTDDFISVVVSSRLAALGEMAGGIAHEIASPLTIIRMLTEGLIEGVKTEPIDKSEISNHSQKILVTLNRIDKLIKSVRAFSRNSEQDPMVESGVLGILEQTFELCSARFEHGNVELRQDLPVEDVFLECRPIQIAQALLNLLNNAFDAVKTLKTRWVEVSVKETPKDVLIRVTDSGSGIPDAIKEKIFESFFTTKGTGHGTGLGLSISLKIVRDHQGTLTINDQSPHTQFILKLPRKQKPGADSGKP